ncbi:MAG TPA: KEOPS complex subunit Cgi121 [Candidatus Bathyarchaeia archaeon]
MLKHIEEFSKHVAVTGFKNVKIKDTEDFLKKICREKKPNTEIQLFDAQHVATWQHLYFAALNALTAFKNKTNISKSLAMETMLYASAQHQIRKATELVGIKHDSSNVAVLVIGDKREIVEAIVSLVSKRVGSLPSDAVLELSPEKSRIIKKAFEISDTESRDISKKVGSEEALVDLVIERMALLATQR